MPTSGKDQPEGDGGAQRSDAEHWAQPFERLTVPNVPAEAVSINIEGRRVAGPIQGFGKMWRKTYSVRLSGCAATPADVIQAWKANFSKFWPGENRFYASLTGIAPGEVAVLNLSAGALKLSTGVLVLYADEESFTFMTPQGHPFAAWITFSAFEEEGCTVAQTHVLMRASDPLYEIALGFGLRKKEDRFWHDTLTTLAQHFGVSEGPQMQVACLDPSRQWSEAKNVWHNAAVRSALYALGAPARWAIRPFRRRPS